MTHRDTRIVTDGHDSHDSHDSHDRQRGTREPEPRDEDDGEDVRVRVPWDQLPPAVLSNVLEEFVTREGTEYGEHDVPLETKVAQVRKQLEKGDIVVLFDGKSGTVNLVPKREVPSDTL